MPSGTGVMTPVASVQPWGPPYVGFCRYCGLLCQFANPRPPGDPDAFTDGPTYYRKAGYKSPSPWHDYTLVDITGSATCAAPAALTSPQVAVGQKPVHALAIPVSGGQPD